MTITIILSALWLGIITAISPCPLATNIAAISFIGRKAGKPKHILSSGLLYALGRTVAYVALGSIITTGLLKSASLSRFLQLYMNEILGPLLIVVGLILLGWIGNSLSLHFNTDKLGKKAQDGSPFWAIVIGTIFALSFCPVSAALFFAGLIPMALNQNSTFILPIVYSIGTSLPVIVFTLLLVFASSYVGKLFNNLTKLDKWIRIVAGTAFIIVGIYYSLTHIFEII